MELALAAWLAVSPLILNDGPEPLLRQWVNHCACPLAVLVIVLMSLRRPSAHHNLLHLAVAGWLVGYPLAAAAFPPPPALQSDIAVALLLAMFCVVPTRSSLHLRGWTDCFDRQMD